MKKLFLLSIIIVCLIDIPQLLAGENVASGKAYTLLPRPNYRLCTDQGDATQLTDGEYSNSNWTSNSTVGWRRPQEIPQITIDLERVFFIDRVEIHTAAGNRGGVGFWAYAVVLASRNGVDFQLAGYARITDDMKEAALQKPLVTCVLSIPNINASGRFVKILIQMETTIFFLDEIKVISADKTHRQAVILPVSISGNYAYNTIKAVEERLELIDSIMETNKGLADHKDLFSPSQSAGLQRKLKELMDNSSKDRLAGISQKQLLEAQKKLGRIRADIYREAYNNPFAVVAADPMKILAQKEMVITPQDTPINISMWQREYESLAFNVINCSSESIRLRSSVAVSPLASEHNKVSPEKVFTLRRAGYVYGLKTGQIADPLILQGNKPFEIGPGQICQIWATINSTGLKPGDYAASFTFRASSKNRALPVKSVPVGLTVQPIEMPEQMELSTINWAYPKLSGITQNNLAETSADLRSHYINVFVFPSQNLPFPKDAKDAKMIIPSKAFAAMDTLINDNKYARMYLLFFSFKASRRDRGRFGEWMSEPWKRNFKSWLVQLVEHLKRNGIGYDRFALYPYDEYIGDDFYDLARLIREIDPQLKIFANSFGKGPREFAGLKDLVDIWCLHQEVSFRNPDWLRTVKSFGKEIWTYKASGPVRSKSPLEHYRKMPWWAFKNGLSGAGFWVYADAGSPRWQEYGTVMGYYGVVYGAANAPDDACREKIIPSRRWEVWREGVEDYQYLAALHNRIARVQAIAPERAGQARQMLEQQVDAVLSGDTTRIPGARKKITRMILELDTLLNGM